MLMSLESVTSQVGNHFQESTEGQVLHPVAVKLKAFESAEKLMQEVRKEESIS